MANPFLMDFDGLLADILIDYGNLDPAPDTGEGSITYIKAACLASMLWGLYRYQDYLAKQIFVDSADTDNLNHHGSIYGIARMTGETDSDYVNRILSALRQPPAGGTALDYLNWAITTPATPPNITETFLPTAVNTGTSQITVTQPWVNNSAVTFTSTVGLPTGLTAGTTYYILKISDTLIQVSTSSGGSPVILSSQGSGVHAILCSSTTTYNVGDAVILTPPTTEAGTVTVVITPDDETIIDTGADETLRRACLARIESLRPVTASGTSVLIVDLVPLGVDIHINSMRQGYTYTITVEEIMKADITAYMDALDPNEPVTIAQLMSICVNDGANGVTVVTPTSDQTPDINQAYRPGYITINYVL